MKRERRNDRGNKNEPAARKKICKLERRAELRRVGTEEMHTRLNLSEEGSPGITSESGKRKWSSATDPGKVRAKSREENGESLTSRGSNRILKKKVTGRNH